MPVVLYQVDSFTDTPFAGNPAAVCVLDRACSEGWMQRVAREMNLSETAFLRPREDGFTLRWFTPTHEVDLCGHATLASAHVLWTEGVLEPDAPARFHTRSGVLETHRDGGWIRMDFPTDPPAETSLPDVLAAALDVEAVEVGRSTRDYLIQVASESVVRALRPDMARLDQCDTRGVIVTAPAASGSYDFVSRFFAPQVGVPEDPVTGSAHCCLGPYWAQRLGKNTLVGRQVSERGGTVHVQLDDPDASRLTLSGHAVTVLRAELVSESETG